MGNTSTQPLGGHRVPLGMLAAAALGFAALGWAAGPSPRAVAVLNSVPLFDDDNGAGMFALTAMAPGVGVERCIRIGSDGTAGAGLVRLAAANVTGGLTDDLAITVDRGTSGRYGDCTGFTGSRIYTGTLTSLAAVPAGVATGWQPRTAGAGRSGSP